MSATGFTERVRAELSRLPLGTPDEQRAEVSALLRLAGRLHLTGATDAPDHVTIELVTTSGAVARRGFALLAAVGARRPELRVRAPGGMRRVSTYGVMIVDEAVALARELWLFPEGDDAVDAVLPGRAVAYLRGAVLVASISTPGRPPHLEIPAVRVASASVVAEALQRATGWSATVSGSDPARVVLKSGEAIGAVLAAVGAANAFLAWDDQRLRRALRGEATRLANADAANVRRSIEAAAGQTRSVQRLVDAVGWDGIEEDLRAVALLRMANPAASLADLAELCDPPLSKAAVHRRLDRLRRLSDEQIPPETP